MFNSKPSPNHTTFKTPEAIFANKYNGQPQCERCWLTVQTISQALDIPVTFDFGYPFALGGNSRAASAIKNASMVHDTVLVSWEHVSTRSPVQCYSGCWMPGSPPKPSPNTTPNKGQSEPVVLFPQLAGDPAWPLSHGY